MPYVQRNSEGRVVALFSEASGSASELLPATHPEVVEFLGESKSDRQFSSLDAGLIRVVEDLVDTLIDKGVLRLTDLPDEAQGKLLARKGLRGRLRDHLRLLDEDDVL